MLTLNSCLPFQTSWVQGLQSCASISSLNLALLGLLCKEDFIVLISLSIMSSRFIPANSPWDFLPFRVWEYPVTCNTLHSVYPPILQWACGCFCLWLLQIRLWISLEVSLLLFLLWICSKVELRDHMVVPFLILWGITILFSLAAKPFLFPQKVHRVLSSLQPHWHWAVFWVWGVVVV